MKLPKDVEGNFIAEWFGHRIFPEPSRTSQSVDDQVNQRCPFLTAAAGTNIECYKKQDSKGVCAVSSVSNGARQDWLTCPTRAFEPALIREIAARMFDLEHDPPITIAASRLEQADTVRTVLSDLSKGRRVLAYFEKESRGEIKIRGTSKSPTFSFDTTFVELLRSGESEITLGRFAILEIQTMDFHGSYANAVKNLRNAIGLHTADFPEQVTRNLKWAADGISTPNIANVFKRTIYQLLFKFGIAAEMKLCAGTALAIPLAVWDSWQPFLAAPELRRLPDGTFVLEDEAASEGTMSFDANDHDRYPALIYVFSINDNSDASPKPLKIEKIIRTSAKALAYRATDQAPRAAIENVGLALYPLVSTKLTEILQPSGVSVVATSTLSPPLGDQERG